MNALPMGHSQFSAALEQASRGVDARVSAGNHDGNDASRQRFDAAIGSRLLSHIRPDPGIRYT